MSAEYKPQEQLAELDVSIDDELVAVRGIVVAYLLLSRQPGVTDESLEPMRAKFAEMAAVIGETIGTTVRIDRPKSVAPVERKPRVAGRPAGRGVVVGLSERRPLRLHDASRAPTVEITTKPISMVLKGSEAAIINDDEVPLTKYDKGILHALHVANGDMVTADDLRLIAKATTSGSVGMSKDMFLSTGRLARRIARVKGYGVITVNEDEGTDIGSTRFGLPLVAGLQYESDIEPPVSSPHVPRVVAPGRVEGSLYGGFIRLDSDAPLNVPDNPIMIEVLADNILYIRDSNRGRAVNIIGNNLFAANALLAIGGMVNKGNVAALAQETDGGNYHINKISTYVDYLSKLLGQSGGRDIILKTDEGTQSMSYGFNPSVVILDRRLQAAEAAEGIRVPGKMDEPEDPSRREDETLGSLAGDYQSVIASFGGVVHADERPQDEVEELIAEKTGVDVIRVQEMLMLHRIGAALKVSLAPSGGVDEEGFAEHVQLVIDSLDEAFRSIDFKDQRVRTSKATILALHLGLPPTIPYLSGMEVTLPNRNASYKYAYERARENGLSFAKLARLVQSNTETIEAVYGRALSDFLPELRIT